MSKYEVCGCDLDLIQKEMLKILNVIDKVCREHNINYILDSGTMLGAVRHKGFIPWDDDADIIMLREDYEKFIEIANKDFSEEFRFECYENTKNYPYNFGKVRSVNTVFKENYTAHLDINHGVYIDIFPMDYAEEKKYLKVIRKIQFFTGVRYTKLRMLKGFSLARIAYTPFCLLPLKTINSILTKLMKYNYKQSDGVCKLCHHGPNKPIIPKSYFTDRIEVEFEDTKFYIPREYDTFLSGRYGDYMKLPPEEKQNPCHNLLEVKI